MAAVKPPVEYRVTGVGEDPLHLVFRAERCLGGRTAPVTRILRGAQSKFSTGVAVDHEMRWEIDAVDNPAAWSDELLSNINALGSSA